MANYRKVAFVLMASGLFVIAANSAWWHLSNRAILAGVSAASFDPDPVGGVVPALGVYFGILMLVAGMAWFGHQAWAFWLWVVGSLPLLGAYFYLSLNDGRLWFQLLWLIALPFCIAPLLRDVALLSNSTAEADARKIGARGSP